MWCSEIILQGNQFLDISIRPGTSFVQDPTLSGVSAVFTLQRQLPGDSIWRDLSFYSLLSVSGIGAAIELASNWSVAETVTYRLGCKNGEYYSGDAWVRLGG
jgi:hypothetical protein